MEQSMYEDEQSMYEGYTEIYRDILSYIELYRVIPILVYTELY